MASMCFLNKPFFKQLAAVTFALGAIAGIFWLDDWIGGHYELPNLESRLSYGLLFLTGFLTSFHCVGMCGPLIVGYASQGARSGQPAKYAHILYASGKTLSYTVIGGGLGALGSVVSFSKEIQIAVGLASGVFLILFGLHALHVFPSLKRFSLRTPKWMMRLLGKRLQQHRGHPLIIGMLNGLMVICGPLQAMYVMAAASGHPLDGALMLLAFGLGTLPLLMGFGYLLNIVSAHVAPRMLKASGCVVIILGAVMLNRGLALAGSEVSFNSLLSRGSEWFGADVQRAELLAQEQVIHMNVDVAGYGPNQYALKKDIPVRWVIEGRHLTECNRILVVPEYGLTIHLKEGEQVIKFTPKKEGVIPWSCSMGILPGTFRVESSGSHESPVSALMKRTRAAIRLWSE